MHQPRSTGLWTRSDALTALPQAYYLDWAKVAAEWTRHFGVLRARLQSLDHGYGDFPAGTGLWDGTGNIACDVLARRVLVPRSLKGLGLNEIPTFAELARRAEASTLKGPFNHDAGIAAGFSGRELTGLTGVTQTRGPAYDSQMQGQLAPPEKSHLSSRSLCFTWCIPLVNTLFRL